MKILHIIGGLNVGGAETVLKRLIESHHDNPDYCHSVISLTEIGKIGQQLQARGIKVQAIGLRSFLNVPRAILSLVRPVVRIARLIRSHSPDIVQKRCGPHGLAK